MDTTATAKTEARAMERFATKRHADHDAPDAFCRKCRRAEGDRRWAAFKAGQAT
jgi:hypothetical protein